MILKFNKNIYDCKLDPVVSGHDCKGVNFTLAVNDNGDNYLIPVEFDLQQVIDSYKDQCSIERILQSTALGDTSVLNGHEGVYLDEQQVRMVEKANDSNALNLELFKLYQDYKDQMSFEDFSKAIITGDFKAFDKKQAAEPPKETE